MKITKHKIRITEPSITKKEINLVTKAVTDSWGKNAYIYNSLFEKKFAEYIGVKYAIATSSCTGALHIALSASGIKASDEVIIPDITWSATAFVIKYLQATPIFADIDPITWCIDPIDVKKKITSKTKAIIPVHLYGHPAEMNQINEIAKKHNLFVIEDAAESIGAEYYGHKTGSIGDFGCFSFHGTKTITTGEGGMITTNNDDLYQKARFLARMAKSPTKLFWTLGIGLKYLMSDMQAALGIAQLSRIEYLLTKKRNIFNWYHDRFKKYYKIKMNGTAPGCLNSYWMPTIVWDNSLNISKEAVMDKLVKYNIDPRPFFYPLSQMPPFTSKVNNPIAYDISNRSINLPCGFSLTKKQADYVVDVILEILGI
jgi:perosamine synthetase